MGAIRRGREFECVLVDVNTQHDFCDSAGAFPVANIPSLIPALRRIIAWAKRNHVPLVSSLESHRPMELSDSGTPIHCVDGSSGQRKLEFTLFSARTNIEVDNTFSVPCDLFHRWQQVIFRKRSDDLLLNPKADRLLTQLPVREFLVVGTGLEGSVKAIALALLARGKPVSVVVDACGYWSRGTAELALRQLAAKGAELIDVCDLCRRKLNREFRYPRRQNGHAPQRVSRAIPQNGGGNGAGTIARGGGVHPLLAGGAAPTDSNTSMRPAISGRRENLRQEGWQHPSGPPLSAQSKDPKIHRQTEDDSADPQGAANQ